MSDNFDIKSFMFEILGAQADEYIDNAVKNYDDEKLNAFYEGMWSYSTIIGGKLYAKFSENQEIPGILSDTLIDVSDRLGHKNGERV